MRYILDKDMGDNERSQEKKIIRDSKHKTKRIEE
jgi:hypothetical protein